jgi:hypothetical protein
VVTEAAGVGGALPDTTAQRGGQATAADRLCAIGSAHGIDCAVVVQPGKHDWPFAARVFDAALPWLAGAIGTPGYSVVPLGAPAPRGSAAVTPRGPGMQSTHAEARGPSLP